jgi:aminodeoxyfutalosine deaminase
VTTPKIELHVHFEGTVGPHSLAGLSGRSIEDLEALYARRDMDSIGEIWSQIVDSLREEQHFRRILVEYAAEAARHGAVYIEGIFSPVEAVRRGVAWEAIFGGYCDGIQEARERSGVEVRLTPDITRGVTVEDAQLTARHAATHRERGIVGLGLGGRDDLSPEPYLPAFDEAREAGLPAVPHAGDFSDADNLRRDLEMLQPARVRHGIRAVDDPRLLGELRERSITLDVCPSSNEVLGTVESLAEHPLPRLIAAGVPCSVSTDDPALFDTDLEREYALARSMGVDERDLYEAAVAGALCDEAARTRLREKGREYRWPGPA